MTPASENVQLKIKLALAEGYPGYLSGQGLMEYGLLPQLGQELYSSALVKYNVVK